MPRPAPCPTCADRRWVSTPTGRARCACYWAILHDAVPLNLKHGESVPPDAPPGVEPWPLVNQVVIGGDYNAFRHQVWRSLVHHLDTDPNFRLQTRYLSLDALRVVEIQFQRDPEFKNVLELLRPGVLILTLGLIYQPAAEFGDKIVKNVLTLREMEGKSSWVFAAHQYDLPQMAFASVFSRSNPAQTAPATHLSGPPVNAAAGETPQRPRSKSAQLRDATAALKRKDAKDKTH